MPALTISFSAAGNQTVSFPTGVSIVGFSWIAATSSAAAVSYDQNVSATSIRAPSANSQDAKLICVLPQGDIPTFFNTVFPVLAGEGVFVSCTAAGSAVIYYHQSS